MQHTIRTNPGLIEHGPWGSRPTGSGSICALGPSQSCFPAVRAGIITSYPLGLSFFFFFLSLRLKVSETVCFFCFCCFSVFKQYWPSHEKLSWSSYNQRVAFQAPKKAIANLQFPQMVPRVTVQTFGKRPNDVPCWDRRSDDVVLLAPLLRTAIWV